jgi:hypothetical protein
MEAMRVAEEAAAAPQPSVDRTPEEPGGRKETAYRPSSRTESTGGGESAGSAKR